MPRRRLIVRAGAMRRERGSGNFVVNKQMMLFIDCYLQNPINAVEAARRAGYKGKQANAAASFLLSNDAIQLVIDQRRQIIERKVDTSIARLVSEMAIPAFADIGDYYYDKGKNKGKLKAFTDMTPQQRRAIQSIEPNQYGTKLKLKSGLAALEMLGRYRKMFSERTPLDDVRDTVSIEVFRRMIDAGAGARREIFARGSDGEDGADGSSPAAGRLLEADDASPPPPSSRKKPGRPKKRLTIEELRNA